MVRRVGRAWRTTGRRVLLYPHDYFVAVNPEDVDRELHILHPDTVTGVTLKDKKHPLVRSESFSKHQTLPSRLSGISYLSGNADISNANLLRRPLGADKSRKKKKRYGNKEK